MNSTAGDGHRPAHRRPPHSTGKLPAPTVLVVRRRDVLALRGADPPRPAGEPPATHGGTDDPRYPSPRTLRRALAFAVDVLVHLAAAIGTGWVYGQQGGDIVVVVLAGLGGYVVASLLHRIVLQAAFVTTFGKALFGLRIIRSADGGDPTMAQCTGAWLLGLLGVLATLTT